MRNKNAIDRVSQGKQINTNAVITLLIFCIKKARRGQRPTPSHSGGKLIFRFWIKNTNA